MSSAMQNCYRRSSFVGLGLLAVLESGIPCATQCAPQFDPFAFREELLAVDGSTQHAVAAEGNRLIVFDYFDGSTIAEWETNSPIIWAEFAAESAVIRYMTTKGFFTWDLETGSPSLLVSFNFLFTGDSPIRAFRYPGDNELLVRTEGGFLFVIDDVPSVVGARQFSLDSGDQPALVPNQDQVLIPGYETSSIWRYLDDTVETTTSLSLGRYNHWAAATNAGTLTLSSTESSGSMGGCFIGFSPGCLQHWTRAGYCQIANEGSPIWQSLDESSGCNTSFTCGGGNSAPTGFPKWGSPLGTHFQFSGLGIVRVSDGRSITIPYYDSLRFHPTFSPGEQISLLQTFNRDSSIDDEKQFGGINLFDVELGASGFFLPVLTENLTEVPQRCDGQMVLHSRNCVYSFPENGVPVVTKPFEPIPEALLPLPQDVWSASPDGSLLVAASNRLFFWNTNTNALLGIFGPYQQHEFARVGWTHDSEYLWGILPFEVTEPVASFEDRLYLFKSEDLKNGIVEPVRVIVLPSALSPMNGFSLLNDTSKAYLVTEGSPASLVEINGLTGTEIDSRPLDAGSPETEFENDTLMISEKNGRGYIKGTGGLYSFALEGDPDAEVVPNAAAAPTYLSDDESTLISSESGKLSAVDVRLNKLIVTTNTSAISQSPGTVLGIAKDYLSLITSKGVLTNLGTAWLGHWASHVLLGTITTEPSSFDINSDSILDISDKIHAISQNR